VAPDRSRGACASTLSPARVVGTRDRERRCFRDGCGDDFVSDPVAG